MKSWVQLMSKPALQGFRDEGSAFDGEFDAEPSGLRREFRG